MFSRALDNARDLLTRSPSKSSETPTAVTNDQVAAMVSTRRGTDTQSPLTSSAARSGTKRFQDDTPNGTPIRNKKKPRKSSDEEEELETPKISLLGQENSQSSLNTQNTKTSEPSSETPQRGRGRPRKSDTAQEQVSTPIPAGKKSESVENPHEEANSAQPDGSQDDTSIYGTPAEDDDASIYATPATTMRPNLCRSARSTPASVTPKPRGRAARTTPSKPSRLISSQTIDEGEEKEQTPTVEPQVVEKPKIIRFGSEDPPAVPEPAPEPRKKTEILTSSTDEVEDSDDEAPEAVTASSAREQARAAEDHAARAVKEQEAAAKRKRQEREARLREQTAASKRRKQQEAELAATSEDVSPPADVASSTTIIASNPAELSKQSKYDLQNIPVRLPDDLLAAAPAVRPPTPEPAVRATGLDRKEIEKKLNKHLKFLDEKPAKDIKKGPVRLHVLENGNKKLPPKVNNQSRNMREQWLAGRRAQASNGKRNFGAERKKTGGGFLRK